jgi:hypothetical protein
VGTGGLGPGDIRYICFNYASAAMRVFLWNRIRASGKYVLPAVTVACASHLTTQSWYLAGFFASSGPAASASGTATSRLLMLGKSSKPALAVFDALSTSPGQTNGTLFVAPNSTCEEQTLHFHGGGSCHLKQEYMPHCQGSSLEVSV